MTNALALLFAATVLAAPSGASIQAAEQPDSPRIVLAQAQDVEGHAPVTNIEPTPVSSAEKRSQLLATLDQLQHEYDDLLAGQGLLPEDAQKNEADRKLHKINKIKNELLKLPVN